MEESTELKVIDGSEVPAEEEFAEQSFVIRVRYKKDGTELPIFDFQPSTGMSPMDCIAMCNQGITWSLEAIEILKRGAPQPNREQRRHPPKEKSRIWTPGSGRMQ